MIEIINSWAQKIIIVVIICTIIEMILPEGKNKKYIKTVIGIYVVFTIISPIISKINNSNTLDLNKYFKTENNITVETSSPVVDTNEYIEEVYKEK
ncbi:MAG: stage III sporulation protein AF, partial [Clostridia bacterium]